MTNLNGTDNQFDSKDFMLAEYQNHLEEYRRSEQLGEARLNLFIAIATAVLGGSGLLIGSDVLGLRSTDLLILLLFAYLATLMFGILALLRTVRRNIVSSKELRAANRVRRYFVERDQSILIYLYHGPYDDCPIRKLHLRGGLVETVMLFNALLSAVLVFTFEEIMLLPLSNYPGTEWFNLSVGFYSFLGACVIQYIFVKEEYDKDTQEAKKEARFPGGS